MTKTSILTAALLLLFSAAISAQNFTTKTVADTLYLVQYERAKTEAGKITYSETLTPFPDTSSLTLYITDQARQLLDRAAKYQQAAQADHSTAKALMELAAKMPALKPQTAKQKKP